jgi:hypothetical protein
MFADALGVRLVLWIGGVVPLPAPVELLQSFSRVEVTNDSGAEDGFQMTFSIQRGPLGYSIPSALKAMNRVIIGIINGIMPEPLIDGIITHVQFNPGTGTQPATLSVTGKDLTTMMDLEEKNATFPNQPDVVIVTQLLAGYARYGVVPAPAPTADVPIMLERIPRQQETDLRFLKRMAERNGYVFYIEPITFGVSKAYWGPQIRAGIPQRALTVDLGSATNVKSLSFTGDALAATGTRGSFIEPFLKLSIPIPALPSLKIPPLAAMPATPNRTTIQRTTGQMNPVTAGLTALAATTNAPDPFTAEGEVDGTRYGGVLRARGLVGVRGAGLENDGFWYVKKVTHTLTRTEYSQKFSLSREGSGTLTPVVIP